MIFSITIIIFLILEHRISKSKNKLKLSISFIFTILSVAIPFVLLTGIFGLRLFPYVAVFSSIYWIPFSFINRHIFNGQGNGFAFSSFGKFLLKLFTALLVTFLLWKLFTGVFLESSYNAPFKDILKKVDKVTQEKLIKVKKTNLNFFKDRVEILGSSGHQYILTNTIFCKSKFLNYENLDVRFKDLSSDLPYNKKEKTLLVISFGKKIMKVRQYELKGGIDNRYAAVIGDTLYLIWSSDYYYLNENKSTFYLKIIDLKNNVELYSNSLFQESFRINKLLLMYFEKTNELMCLYSSLDDSKGLRYSKINISLKTKPYISFHSSLLFPNEYSIEYDGIRYVKLDSVGYLLSNLRGNNKFFGYAGNQKTSGILKFTENGVFSSFKILHLPTRKINSVYINYKNYVLFSDEKKNKYKIHFDEMYELKKN